MELRASGSFEAIAAAVGMMMRELLGTEAAKEMVARLMSLPLPGETPVARQTAGLFLVLAASEMCRDPLLEAEPGGLGAECAEVH